MAMLFLYNIAYSQGKKAIITERQKYKNELSPLTTSNFVAEAYRPDSSHMYYFYSNTDSVTSNSTVYTYNTFGKLTQLKYASIYREEFTYNEKNLLTEHRYYQYDADNLSYDTIMPTVKYTYNYDNMNRKISENSFGWNYELMVWSTDTTYEEEYIYDSTGILMRINVFDFQPSIHKNPTRIIDYNYNKTTRILTEVGKQDYLYDGLWELEDSTQYVFNNDSLCLVKDNYLYNFVDSVWDHNFLYEYSYDNSGKIQYEVSGAFWPNYYVPNYKYIYTYNSDNLLIHEADMAWDESKQIWKNLNSIVYYYSDQNQSANPIITADLNLQQKTDNNHLFNEVPEGSEIIVYNMNGIKVMQQICNNGIVPVSELPTGIYAIRIINKGNPLLNQVFIKK